MIVYEVWGDNSITYTSYGSYVNREDAELKKRIMMVHMPTVNIVEVEIEDNPPAAETLFSAEGCISDSGKLLRYVSFPEMMMSQLMRSSLQCFMINLSDSSCMQRTIQA